MNDRLGLSELASVPVLATITDSFETIATTAASAVVAYLVRLGAAWIRRRINRVDAGEK